MLLRRRRVNGCSRPRDRLVSPKHVVAISMGGGLVVEGGLVAGEVQLAGEGVRVVGRVVARVPLAGLPGQLVRLVEPAHLPQRHRQALGGAQGIDEVLAEDRAVPLVDRRGAARRTRRSRPRPACREPASPPSAACTGDRSPSTPCRRVSVSASRSRAREQSPTRRRSTARLFAADRVARLVLAERVLAAGRRSPRPSPAPRGTRRGRAGRRRGCPRSAACAGGRRRATARCLA